MPMRRSPIRTRMPAASADALRLSFQRPTPGAKTESVARAGARGFGRDEQKIAGAKALVFCCFSARLKSCPDTRRGGRLGSSFPTLSQSARKDGARSVGSVEGVYTATPGRTIARGMRRTPVKSSLISLCRRWRPLALLAALRKAFSVLPPVPDLPVPDVSHGVCLRHGAADRAVHRAVGDSEAARVPDRPVRARRRAAVAPEEVGHADHGRRADCASPFCCRRCCGRTRPIPLSGSRSFRRWPSGQSALPTTTSKSSRGAAWA